MYFLAFQELFRLKDLLKEEDKEVPASKQHMVTGRFHFQLLLNLQVLCLAGHAYFVNRYRGASESALRSGVRHLLERYSYLSDGR